MSTGTLKRLASPGLVPNTLTTIYTVPGSTKTTNILISLMNDDTQDNLIDLYIIPSAGSATATNKRFKGSKPNGLWLSPGSTVEVDLVDILEAGSFIQVISNVNNKVSYQISGMEIT